MPPIMKMPKKITRLNSPYMAVTISVKNSGSPATGFTKRMSKNRPGASAMASQNVVPHFHASTSPAMIVKTTHLNMRFMRKRRHGLTLSIRRFQAPQTCCSQNWL